MQKVTKYRDGGMKYCLKVGSGEMFLKRNNQAAISEVYNVRI
ncbi:hypothetical protein ANME2D_03310 [Candidatus Methanoperedens nitroreducens]|uniref:Uncharacterized protein n=1 Tax=Candidatus Methanoperedens nitratireducens TaxID=1392998 RepID=A0A062V4T4_9EURY|nr:hypothetical protein ANME2D_03310 [Candidatus Methanoperedens nitroreducens]